MKKTDIIDAYLWIRKNNSSIPDNVLDLMKDSAIEVLNKMENSRECFSCKNDGFQNIFPSACTGCGGNGELINFKLRT